MVLTRFRKTVNCHSSWKSARWHRVVSCGRTDMTKLIFAFRSFANAPDYRSQPLGLLGTRRRLLVQIRALFVKDGWHWYLHISVSPLPTFDNSLSKVRTTFGRKVFYKVSSLLLILSHRVGNWTLDTTAWIFLSATNVGQFVHMYPLFCYVCYVLILSLFGFCIFVFVWGTSCCLHT